MKTDALLVVGYIKAYHAGIEKAVHATELAKRLRLKSTRHLRDLVHEARENRHPIISTFDGGYCWPTGPEDDALDHAIRQQTEMGLRYLENARNLERGREEYWPRTRLFEVKVRA